MITDICGKQIKCGDKILFAQNDKLVNGIVIDIFIEEIVKVNNSFLSYKVKKSIKDSLSDNYFDKQIFIYIGYDISNECDYHSNFIDIETYKNFCIRNVNDVILI